MARKKNDKPYAGSPYEKNIDAGLQAILAFPESDQFRQNNAGWLEYLRRRFSLGARYRFADVVPRGKTLDLSTSPYSRIIEGAGGVPEKHLAALQEGTPMYYVLHAMYADMRPESAGIHAKMRERYDLLAPPDPYPMVVRSFIAIAARFLSFVTDGNPPPGFADDFDVYRGGALAIATGPSTAPDVRTIAITAASFMGGLRNELDPWIARMAARQQSDGNWISSVDRKENCGLGVFAVWAMLEHTVPEKNKNPVLAPAAAGGKTK